MHSGLPVQCIFIFDDQILKELPVADARVEFLHIEVQTLNEQIRKFGGSLHVQKGNPLQLIPHLVQEFHAKTLYLNHDYEPRAILRDKEIRSLLESRGIQFHSFKDQVIFEKDEVQTNQGGIYRVFTPYAKNWKRRLSDDDLKPYKIQTYHFLSSENKTCPSLKEIGFQKTGISFPPREISLNTIQKYDQTRDFPWMENGTTHLGIHLRFGTISIRRLAKLALQENETFLNELIWRDFFFQILYHHPQTANQSYRNDFETFPWRNDLQSFELWKAGRTGYPFVDAGMRELAATGFMHNRVRMNVASFLTKHLLLPWQWGERFFAEKLLDYDSSANTGNWQWAAGCGTDAAPYFRIFNPASQAKKFDPDGIYIRKWIPEIETPDYPQPCVDHSFARNRALAAWDRMRSHRKS
jgi:deoxyribodipyrimidine photo-lyase